MFLLDTTVGAARVAFTDRHGGVSEGPFASLDLGAGGGDDPDRVRSNLERVVTAVGADPARLVLMRQVHGADAVVVDHVPVKPPRCDALVTATPGLVLMTRAADCLPVVLADPDSSVCAVAHAGRQGMAAGVVAAAVEAARGLGAGPALRAHLGPRVCGGCYEVPAAMRDEVAAAEPAAWATTTWGTPAVDLAAGVRAQLARLEVAVVDLADQLGVPAACTRESADLYSYRRQGVRSGRLAGLVHVAP